MKWYEGIDYMLWIKQIEILGDWICECENNNQRSKARAIARARKHMSVKMLISMES